MARLPAGYGLGLLLNRATSLVARPYCGQLQISTKTAAQGLAVRKGLEFHFSWLCIVSVVLLVTIESGEVLTSTNLLR